MISLVKCPCEYIDPVLLVEPHLGHENLGQVQSTERDQFSTRESSTSRTGQETPGAAT